MEDVAALVFGKSIQKDTFVPEDSQSFSFITHIPEDMEDDGIDNIETWMHLKKRILMEYLKELKVKTFGLLCSSHHKIYFLVEALHIVSTLLS